MSETEISDTLPLLEWLTIPSGKVKLFNEEVMDVNGFKIAKYPVTNKQFAAFVDDDGYKTPSWWDELAVAPRSPRKSDWLEGDAPKLQVAWFEAIAFCRWLSAQTKATIRLPNEWEWQWAAVGDSGCDFPFGAFDTDKCNTKEAQLGRANPVTQFAEVKTLFGTTDMAGNVWEWCLNEGQEPHNSQLSGTENRVLRGGSWNNKSDHAKASHRIHRTPRTRTFNIGLRLLMEL